MLPLTRHSLETAFAGHPVDERAPAREQVCAVLVPLDDGPLSSRESSSRVGFPKCLGGRVVVVNGGNKPRGELTVDAAPDTGLPLGPERPIACQPPLMTARVRGPLAPREAMMRGPDRDTIGRRPLPSSRAATRLSVSASPARA